MSSNWIQFNLIDKELETVLRYGKLMHDGGIGMSNVKHKDKDNIENYTDGKLGEMLFGKWAKRNLIIKIIHHPFRSGYAKLDPNDDFIIELHGKQVQIEVRHKTRNRLPKPNYSHCSPPPILEDRIYVFTDRCRADKPMVKELTIDHFRGDSFLLGWIDAKGFMSNGTLAKKGTPMYNNKGEINFRTSRDEWNIEISKLYEMEDLLNPYNNIIPWRK